MHKIVFVTKCKNLKKYVNLICVYWFEQFSSKGQEPEGFLTERKDGI